MAQVPDREAELERRLKTLEDVVVGLRAELDASRKSNAVVPGTVTAPPGIAARSTATADLGRAGGQGISAGIQPAQPQASSAVAAATPPKDSGDGFKVGSTTIKLGGYVKLWAAASRTSDGSIANNTVGRDFYFPGLIPVGGAHEGRDIEANAKQTRIQLTTATPIGDHTLKSLIELDFQVAPGTQGNARVVNGYNLGLRRAFLTFDNFLFGQEWSVFQYVAALPESTDFVGPSEGTVFVRQAQVRYTRKISPQLELAIAVENPDTTSSGLTNATQVDNGDDRLPDLTARAVYKPDFGEFSLAGLVRKLTVDTGSNQSSTQGWGVSLAGKVPFGPGKQYDVRFMITHGEGIGRYLGLGLVPDAVYGALASDRLETVAATAGFAALRLGWTAKLRSTVGYSFQHASYPDVYTFAGGTKSAWSASGNLFYSPVPPLDIGIEYRRGERELLSGESGTLDRIEFGAKYSF